MAEEKIMNPAKSVLISIKPLWVDKIANGLKTVEIRKNRPKLETPFKCYIYCTKGKGIWKRKNQILPDEQYNRLIDDLPDCALNQKVIGEFICDEINNMCLSNLVVKEDTEKSLMGSCLSKENVLDYLGYERGTPIYKSKHFNFYGWHISSFVIYDRPKNLGDFQIAKPPQSWRYVQEV